MDTKRETHNLPIHKHPLFPSAMFRLVECNGCHVEETIYGGYFCNELYCKAWFHKECAEAPPEIYHHPSHLEHPLLLTTNDSQTKDSPCDFCGKQLLSPCYMCPTCEFKVDFICGIKPSPCDIEHPVCHDHSLVFLKTLEEEEVQCEVCMESIGGPSYSCPECNNVYFHLDCVHLSKEVNHPFHSNHPLKIIASESLKDDDYLVDDFCRLCSIRPKEMLYHCSVCNFNLCLDCIKIPPPLVVNHAKTHTHPLRLVSIKLEFTCKFCGIRGYDNKPYICLKCTFLVHGKCIGLPRVININRHDHRIYFTYHHGHGRCGVCRGNVSQYYGAYSCSVCPNYTVHSQCAVDLSVWNGVELEGTPEGDEDIAPFKVVGHNLIRHFSHSKHILRLLKDNAIQEDECIC